MNPTIKIAFLADNPQFIGQIAEWNVNEWPDHYRRGGIEDASIELQNSLNKDHLPITLVGMMGGNLVGSVSLVVTDLPGRPDLGPWLTSLYVHPDCRGFHVVEKLLCGGLHQFSELGEPHVYAWLEKNVYVYQRWGWRLFETARYRNNDTYIMKGDVPYLIKSQKGLSQ